MGYSVLDNKKSTSSKWDAFIGSPNWTWTSDTLINSQVLYRLSYGGIKDERLEIALTSSYVGKYRFSRAVAGEVS